MRITRTLRIAFMLACLIAGSQILHQHDIARLMATIDPGEKVVVQVRRVEQELMLESQAPPVVR